MNTALFSKASLATSCDTEGLIVEQSINSDPGDMFLKIIASLRVTVHNFLFLGLKCKNYKMF